MNPLVYPLADLELSRRLERTEAAGCYGFVDARRRVQPEIGAEWCEIGGTFAMYDGLDSPITQTFNLGMTQPVSAEMLDAIEAFYRQRGASVLHEVSPLADDSARVLLTARGYRPIEFTSVMYRPIEPGVSLQGSTTTRISVRRMEQPDAPSWIEASVAGWDEYAAVADMLRELGRVTTQRSDVWCYLAELDGATVATGALTTHGDVALCAGASTIPSARGRGAQLALLEYRLRDAATAGCTLAMMCARPGSGSQRNAERHGFRIAYTRIKWEAPSA